MSCLLGCCVLVLFSTVVGRTHIRRTTSTFPTQKDKSLEFLDLKDLIFLVSSFLSTLDLGRFCDGGQKR